MTTKVDNASQTIQVGQLVELQILSLSSNGDGVARHHGIVVFVADTAPQELVRAQISEFKKNFARAKLVEVLQPSPQRRTPPCPVARECGGCTWQHLTYSEQLLHKSQIVQDALTRIAKLPPWPELQIIPSPKEFRYRNRIQVHTEKSRLGFLGRGSHRLIAVEDCLLADERLVASFPLIDTSRTTRLELRLNETGEVRYGAGHDNEEFGQVNSEQNLALIAEVTSLSQALNCDHVLDLYCGDGNLSFPLLAQASHLSLTGIELNARAVNQARQHANHLNYKADQVQFVCGPCDRHLPTQISPTTLVILDPPRAGCEPAMISYLAQRTQQLIYVSCNPATWARDITLLVKHGLELSSLKVIDMFPQTPHVELVSLFKRPSTTP